jgi:PELOTA RNA binding domain
VVGPDDFHGAKFYLHLAQADLSNHYLDAISAHFGDVADAAARRARELAVSPRPPRHTGWATARRIGALHGVEDMNFVKPGVGETTRALLRRVPWKVLIDHTSPPLPYIRLLASQRRAHLLGRRPAVLLRRANPPARQYPTSVGIPGGILAARDLDGTLIYSHSVIDSNWAIQATQYSAALVCVEYYRDQPWSYLTARAARQTEELAHAATLVPDPDWHRETRRRVTASAAPLPEVHAHVQHTLSRSWPATVQVAEEMFVYLVTNRNWALPVDWINDLTHWAHAHGWELSVTGRKVHLVPAALTKSAAIHPAHGELAASGWSHPTVTRTQATGVSAGEEILRWLYAAAHECDF